MNVVEGAELRRGLTETDLRVPATVGPGPVRRLETISVWQEQGAKHGVYGLLDAANNDSVV